MNPRTESLIAHGHPRLLALLLSLIPLLAGACAATPGARPFVGPEPPTIAVWNATDAALTHFSLQETFSSGTSSTSRRSNPSNISSRIGTISGAAPNSVMFFPRGKSPPPLPMRVRVTWSVGSEPRQRFEGSLRQVVADATGNADEVLVFRIDRAHGLRVLLATRDDLPAY